MQFQNRICANRTHPVTGTRILVPDVHMRNQQENTVWLEATLVGEGTSLKSARWRRLDWYLSVFAVSVLPYCSYLVTLTSYYEPFSWHSYLYPFIIVIGISLFLMACFMVRRDVLARYTCYCSHTCTHTHTRTHTHARTHARTHTHTH